MHLIIPLILNLYKTRTAEPYSFLEINTTHASDNSLHFRENLLERMTIDEKIKDEKLQYNIDRPAAKISEFSSRKIDKHEHLTCEEILRSDQGSIIEQAKFKFSPPGKAIE